MASKVVQPWCAARSSENELDRESVWVFGAAVKGVEDLRRYINSRGHSMAKPSLIRDANMQESVLL